MQLVLISEDDKVTCVAVKGDISQAQFTSGSSDPLEDLLSRGCYARRVLFDLGQTDFIDSSGVSWLMVCHRRFLADSGKLVLYSVPPLVDQVLRLLQLHHMLAIKPDKAAALAAIAP